MKITLKVAALVLTISIVTALPFAASAQTAAKAADPAVVDAYLRATFGKAPPEWQARIEPDETLKICNQYRNDVPSAEADKIVSDMEAEATKRSAGGAILPELAEWLAWARAYVQRLDPLSAPEIDVHLLKPDPSLYWLMR